MVTQFKESARIINMTEDNKGTVFNIQRYSIQDGPGIRTTVFLKGCPLQCAWCSNPESQKFEPEIVHRDSLCNKCGQCANVCELRAIKVDDQSIHINRNLCNNCGKCAEVCSTGSLKILGSTLTPGEVFKEVEKDSEFYRNSGGGLTASGGEALAQADFVAILFKLCRDKGIHTCVETTGSVGVKSLEKVLPYTSLFLYDIKLSSPENHNKWTKRSNEQILKNLGLIVDSGTPIIIRIPLITGINTSDQELKNLARIALDILKPPRIVQLLPYHRFGIGKYQMLDRQYELPDLLTPHKIEIQKSKEVFETFGLECEVVL